MDLTDLDERYPDGIPENLQPGVKKLKELCKKKGIKSVKLYGKLFSRFGTFFATQYRRIQGRYCSSNTRIQTYRSR